MNDIWWTTMGEVPVGQETVEKYGIMYIHGIYLYIALVSWRKNEYLVRYRAVIVAHPNLARD